MEFGYAIYYKDAQGFEVAYHTEYDGNPLGQILVYKNKHQIKTPFDEVKSRISDILKYGMPIYGKRKKWFFWEEEVIERVSLSIPEYRNMQRLHDTLFIKQVRVV